jgi:hypothetical protein
MAFFHVAHGPLAPGTLLRPYSLAQERPETLTLVTGLLDGDAPARVALLTEVGRLRERYRTDPEMQLVFIEAVFERARLTVAPDLPSGFDSVYLWPTLTSTQTFRDRYRPRGVILRCTIEEGRPVSRDPSFVAIGMDLAGVVEDEVRLIERRALAYWTTEPAADIAEILVRGRVIATDVLPSES